MKVNDIIPYIFIFIDDFMINLNEVKIECRLCVNFICQAASGLIVMKVEKISQFFIVTFDNKLFYYLFKMFKIIYFILLLCLL